MQGKNGCGCQECRKKERSRTMKETGSASQGSEYNNSKETTSKGEQKQSLIKLLLIRFPGKVRKQKKKG